MNLSELRDAIRVESGLKDPESYTATLDRLINVTFRKYTGMNKYREMRKSTPLVVAAPLQTEFTLPEDFQLIDDLLYNDSSINIFGALTSQSRRRTVLSNTAARFAEIVGTSLFLLPGEQIATSDTLVLKYYGFVDLIADDDEHPIRAMEDVIINAVSARMLFITGDARAKGAAQLEKDAFNKLRSEYAGKS